MGHLNPSQSSLKQEFLERHLRCPECQSNRLVFNSIQVRCQNCDQRFPVIQEKPVLIRNDNEVFSVSSYLSKNVEATQRPSWFNIIPSPSVNISYRNNLTNFFDILNKDIENYVLVLGSGKQKQWLEEFFSENGHIHLIYCDIDINANVDLFCDAHDIPFEEETFHGVITTAVLEHVLYPERVVSEIHRVLIDGGIIYSEIPFMQQVHEGAYDFTRYSLSGHRRLLNHFSELSTGLVAGPGTVLVWSIEHFALCFAWSPGSRALLKALVRLIFFWLKYFDYIFQNNPEALDGASATYFLGSKKIDEQTSDKLIVERYVGADRVRHV